MLLSSYIVNLTYYSKFAIYITHIERSNDTICSIAKCTFSIGNEIYIISQDNLIQL